MMQKKKSRLRLKQVLAVFIAAAMVFTNAAPSVSTVYANEKNLQTGENDTAGTGGDEGQASDVNSSQENESTDEGNSSEESSDSEKGGSSEEDSSDTGDSSEENVSEGDSSNTDQSEEPDDSEKTDTEEGENTEKSEEEIEDETSMSDSEDETSTDENEEKTPADESEEEPPAGENDEETFADASDETEGSADDSQESVTAEEEAEKEDETAAESEAVKENENTAKKETVTAEEEGYSVEYTVEPEDGATVSGADKVDEEEDLSFTVRVKDGYQLETVEVNGDVLDPEEQEENRYSYTVEEVSEDLSVYILLKEISTEAFYQTIVVEDGTEFAFEAEAGVVPDGAEFSVELDTDGDKEEAIKTELGENIVVSAYTISLLGEDSENLADEDIQGSVKVSLLSLANEDEEEN